MLFTLIFDRQAAEFDCGAMNLGCIQYGKQQIVGARIIVNVVVAAMNAALLPNLKHGICSLLPIWVKES